MLCFIIVIMIMIIMYQWADDANGQWLLDQCLMYPKASRENNSLAIARY